MTDALLPLELADAPVKAPKKPTAGKTKPAWSDYNPKTRPDCDHCCEVAYDSLMDGSGFGGLRKARRKRRQDGANLLLCHEHAAIQKAKDDVDFAGVKPEPASRGKRYIA